MAAPRPPPTAPPTMAPAAPPKRAPPSVLFCAIASCAGIASARPSAAAIPNFRIIENPPVVILSACWHRGRPRSISGATAKNTYAFEPAAFLPQPMLERESRSSAGSGCRKQVMRASVIPLLLGVVLMTQPAVAYDAEDPANCNGIEWDNDQALVVSKVTASPRVNFVKSPYDDDFKADSCPAAIDACRRK